jgi:hypothetical protein
VPGVYSGAANCDCDFSVLHLRNVTLFNFTIRAHPIGKTSTHISFQCGTQNYRAPNNKAPPRQWLHKFSYAEGGSPSTVPRSIIRLENFEYRNNVCISKHYINMLCFVVVDRNPFLQIIIGEPYETDHSLCTSIDTSAGRCPTSLLFLAGSFENHQYVFMRSLFS